MAPGSVPTGSGRAGSFSSSEILEQVALALAAAAGLAFGLVLSWVFGACGGGWTLSVPFRFANERAREQPTERGMVPMDGMYRTGCTVRRVCT